jgi:hypothetical protein
MVRLHFQFDRTHAAESAVNLVMLTTNNILRSQDSLEFSYQQHFDDPGIGQMSEDATCCRQRSP